jgi:hypothetical protein
MMTPGWWLLGVATALVFSVGSLGLGSASCTRGGSDSQLAVGGEGYVHEQQAQAVQRLMNDVRWERIDQREGLCSALIDSARLARASGAIPARSVTLAWLPPQTVHAGLADEALAQRRDDLSRHARVYRVLRDARWAIPHQRGPLCNALVVAERQAPVVS